MRVGFISISKQDSFELWSKSMNNCLDQVVNLLIKKKKNPIEYYQSKCGKEKKAEKSKLNLGYPLT